jgi:predicted nucleic acid-binding protein
MLGTSVETRWGVLPLVTDTSAWMRSRHPAVRGLWQEADLLGMLRLSPVVALEVLFAAKNQRAFDDSARLLSRVRSAPISPGVTKAAESAMRALAGRAAGAHRISPVDYLVAAAAQELGGAVLHYDRDFDRLAEVMNFESVWLAPPGSIP